MIGIDHVELQVPALTFRYTFRNAQGTSKQHHLEFQKPLAKTRFQARMVFVCVPTTPRNTR